MQVHIHYSWDSADSGWATMNTSFWIAIISYLSMKTKKGWYDYQSMAFSEWKTQSYKTKLH